MKKPLCKFVIQSLDYSAENLLCFEGEMLNNFLGAQFGLQEDVLVGKTKKQKFETLKNIISPYYEKNLPLLKDCHKKTTNNWAIIQGEVLSEFEKIFDFKFLTETEKYTGAFTVSFIAPRYLDDKRFDFFLCDDISWHIDTVIHELTHFVWFEKWKEVFPNYRPQNFEHPALEWLFSEIAIDAIFANSRLKIFTREKPAYQQFYGAFVSGEPILETFDKLFKNNTIENFMKKGIEYIYDNKKDFKKLI